MTTAIQSIAIWFENEGLGKLKIDAIFTVFKLVSIFGISSIPFWLEFNKQPLEITINHDLLNSTIINRQLFQIDNSTIQQLYNNDISSIKTTLKWGGLWGYYFVSYLVMSYFICKPLFQKVENVSCNKEYFESKGLLIDTTESITFDQLLRTLEIEKEEFITEAVSMDNFLLAFEDKGYFKISLPIFKSILATRPFEIAITWLLKHYYIDNTYWTFKNAQDNASSFSALSRKAGLILIPFLPVLVIFSTINHIVTYINNREFLTLYDWNRLGVWKFRYYNEFLISAKKRLDKTKDAAESVVTDLFLEGWRSSISKMFSFLFSLFSLFLFIFSFNGYEKLWGMDILPIIALFSLLSVILFPRKKLIEGRMAILKEIKNDITRKEIALYFESKISILLKEILSLFYLPFLLIWVIPNHSYFFSTFMATYNKDNICTFANWSNKDATPKTKTSYDYASGLYNPRDSFMV